MDTQRIPVILASQSPRRIELLKTIIENEPIWVTIEADNPNIQGFQFNFHESGSVAGDHFF